MNEIITKQFENTGVEIILNEQGEPLFELYSTGMAIGQVKISKGTAYPRKDRIDQNVINAEISTVVRDGKQYLTESMLYDLMLEAKTDKCRTFRKWLTNDVLPTLRKTGSYIIQNNQLEEVNKQIMYLKSIVEEFEMATERAREQYKPSHKRKLNYNKSIKMLSANKEEEEDIKNWVFVSLNIDKWEDACVDDHEKIIDAIKTGAKLLAINKITLI